MQKLILATPQIERKAYPIHASLWIMGLFLLILLSIFSLTIGIKPIPLSTILNSLYQQTTTPESLIIWQSRLPRTLAGIIVGIALAISGVVMQALTRNPLAEPGILGVNNGATFSIVVGFTWFGASSASEYLFFSLFGACLSSLLVFLLGRGHGKQSDTARLLLAGIAINAFLSGLISSISLLHPETFNFWRYWQAGTLDIRDLQRLKIILLPVLTGVFLSFFLAPALNCMSMGNDIAISLGHSATRTQCLAVLCITLLCGSATAAVGPISFIGLMVPYLARKFVGVELKKVLYFSLLFSPILLLCADLIGRLMPGGEVRVSIMAAFIGAPILIALVRRRQW